MASTPSMSPAPGGRSSSHTRYGAGGVTPGLHSSSSRARDGAGGVTLGLRTQHGRLGLGEPVLEQGLTPQRCSLL